MKTVKLLIMLIFIYGTLNSSILTVPESSDFKRTSLYSEVMDFLDYMKKNSGKIKISTLCKTTEGRDIPLVIVSEEGISSPEQMKALNKRSILFMANIHAGEIEGKDASLMFLRDIVENKAGDILKDQVILIIPIFNADGNEKLGKNRMDEGPELAGVRHNGQYLDLNRDYIKLESPEVIALVGLFREWDPVLFVDLHTTNGSWHQEPVTYSTLSNPNSSQNLMDFMWKKMFPAVQKIMKTKFKTDSIPYGNFVDRAFPEKGWRNHAYEARFGTNYAGLRNRFTILDENYAHADFKTRVLSAYYFIRSISEFTSENIIEMETMVKKADIETISGYSSGNHVLSFKQEPGKLFDFTIKSYEFEKEKIKPEDRSKYPWWVKDFIVKKTERLKDYKVSYYAKALPDTTTPVPSAYIILPYHNEVISNLKKHGIIVEKIEEEFSGEFENFIISDIQYGKSLYQGHILLDIKGDYKKIEQNIPAGSYLVPMNQPLARLIAEMLEPGSGDSLLKWGFFNRELVKQWSRKPGEYPVLKMMKHKTDILSVIE